MELLKLDETESTNSWVARHALELPTPVLVWCHTQTAGRGQRGNSWESEPGKNITASLLFHPDNYPAIDQFAISEAIAIAISDFLLSQGVEPKIKWPNDIYVGDKKICGILVEHVVTGRNISRTIAGFGININQKEFLSDAPNPVSLSLITGKEYSLEECVEKLSGYLVAALQSLGNKEELHSSFLSRLWRKDGKCHRFYDRKNHRPLMGKIMGVRPQGILEVEDEEGRKEEYAFKEIEFIL